MTKRETHRRRSPSRDGVKERIIRDVFVRLYPREKIEFINWAGRSHNEMWLKHKHNQYEWIGNIYDGDPSHLKVSVPVTLNLMMFYAHHLMDDNEFSLKNKKLFRKLYSELLSGGAEIKEVIKLRDEY